MTSFLTHQHYKRESFPASYGHQLTERKKIKKYSYSPSDKIGKGFSSVVYKGTNDETSTFEFKQIKL